MNTECKSFLLIEDENVRVTRFEFEPGQETGWHEHQYDYVITAVTDCSLSLSHPDGTTTSTVVIAGDAYKRSAGVRHNVKNAGNRPMIFVEIELK